MATFKAAIFSGCVLLAAATASAASAATVIITDVQAGYSESSVTKVTIGRSSEAWTTPILVTERGGQPEVVFCDDLQHNISTGNHQSLSYHTGLVTTNGLGKSISETVSNEMGQLADIGAFDYSHGNEDGAIAAQAEIWGLEYGETAASANRTVETDILGLVNSLHNNGEGWATGLISNTGEQSFVTGLGSVGGVPEPATWAMLILGVAMIGASARRRRAAGLCAAAA